MMIHTEGKCHAPYLTLAYPMEAPHHRSVEPTKTYSTGIELSVTGDYPNRPSTLAQPVFSIRYDEAFE